MTGVQMLRHEEKVRIDSDRLLVLYVELGEAGAETFVCRAMDELAARLAEMAVQYRAGQIGPFRENAAGMGRVAERIGMMTLARVTEDAVNCVDAGNRPGLAAIWARLLRIGDRSLIAVWDLRDRSV